MKKQPDRKERMPHSVVIHGHFYQPPREDPWSGKVEGQPSAAPFHNWNARIEAECYRPVAAARIPGKEGRIREIMNTLRHISFNFGPTLLSWMEEEAPRTYHAILEADILSRQALGHGNAMAQAYHHSILPLASRRDKVTEVRWGVEDFRRRFRRDPEGMWLPETAVDDETLDVLAQEDIAFTVVAPHQVDRLPRQGMPGLYRTRGGRTIALFVYDGPLSHDVAFGPLLRDGDAWARRMARERPDPGAHEQWASETGGSTSAQNPGGQGRASLRAHLPRRLICIATDGETYGHHHRFGEMGLATALKRLRADSGVRVENFASFLAHSPPLEEVGLLEPSSWSCSHGVGRWTRDCGCKMDPPKPSQQIWRTGLREAMEWLAGKIHDEYAAEGDALLGDPWEARNAYGRVAAGAETLEAFLETRLGPGASNEEQSRAARLLELEWYALRLFTSCAWFFDDLSGIEPRQILRYADRALELLEERKEEAEAGFLTRLRKAFSNEDPPRDGATLFREEREARGLVRYWVPEDDDPEGTTPQESLEVRLGLALETAVQSLRSHCAHQESDAGARSRSELIHDVGRLAYLHARGRIPIPFDAQTDFYRLWVTAPENLQKALSPLRKPLGFVSDHD